MKRLGILFLIPLLIMASAMLPTAVNAKTDDTQQAEQMLKMAEKARVRVDAIFELAQQKNLTISANSTTARNEGNTLLAQAQATYNAGNYTQSMQLSFSAMHQYRIAIAPLLTLLDEEDLDIGPINLRLREAIRLREEYLLRVRLILDRAQAAGFNVTNIENRLRTAEMHLNNATNLLNQGNVDAAAQELGRVRSSFAGVMDDLQHLAKEQNRRRIGNFVDGQGHLLRNLERSIEQAEQRGLNVTDARANIEEAIQSLEEAESLVEQGNIDEAVTKMKDARREAHDAQQELREQQHDKLHEKLQQRDQLQDQQLDRLQQQEQHHQKQQQRERQQLQPM